MQLNPEPIEQKAVELARSLRTKKRSYRAIAADLAAAGHLPRGGNAWHPQTVANILAAA